MACPKKKTSRSRRDSRRAHHDKIVVKSLATCSRCGAPRMPHRACPKCGFYRDRIAIMVEKPAE